MNMSFSDSHTPFLKVNGLSIAYRHFGTGFPVLFYNRFRGILDSWDPLFLDTLATNYSIILFDYPGIGDSQGELPTEITDVAAVGVQLMKLLPVTSIYFFNTNHFTQKYTI